MYFPVKEFRVIQILDEYAVVVNYGSNDGAREGEKVRVFEYGTHQITGIYGERLGRLDIKKEDLEIVTTYPEYSICQKIEFVEMNPYLDLGVFKKTKKDVRINVENGEILRTRYKTNEPIKIGDLVSVLKK